MLTPPRRFLPPNTPHATVFLEPSIYHRTNFFASSTLAQTFYGQVHTLFFGKNVTKLEPTALSLLPRIMLYFYDQLVVNKRTSEGENYFHLKTIPNMKHADDGHLPELDTPESVENLFTFCNAIEMANLIAAGTHQVAKPNPSTLIGLSPDLAHFKFDINAIDLKTRQLLVYARGVKEELLDWFFANYDLVDAKSEVLEDGRSQVHNSLLAWHCYCIAKTFELLPADVREGGALGGDTQEFLFLQISHIIDGRSDVADKLSAYADSGSPPMLNWDDTARGGPFGVRKKDVPEQTG